MPETPKEEKLEFLKREEIKTMQKDIAGLREIEAQKERDKIAALEIEGKKEIKTKTEEIKREVKREVSLPGEILPTTDLTPKPKILKIYPFKKYLIRVGFVLFFIATIAAISWYFGHGGKPVEEAETPPPKEEVKKPEIVVPNSLIPVAGTKDFEILSNEEIPGLFSKILSEELPKDFARIVIKNTGENRLASLEDISGAFQIKTPVEIFPKLETDFTLAVYSQQQGERLILVARTKESLTDILKNWETAIKNEGISVSGNKINSLVSSFKAFTYKGTPLRFLTISKTDLGICYALFDNYFVFTTSLEGLKKAVNILKAY